MFATKQVIYLYDGSLNGFYCCVFESFLRKEIPADIIPEPQWEPTLYAERQILTSPEKAARVQSWLFEKLSPRLRDSILRGYLAVFAQKELHLLRVLHLGFQKGEATLEFVQEPSVLALKQALVALGREVEKFLGFVRFSEYDSALVAVIEPVAYVLPLMQHHFCDRYANTTFLLYDQTHKAGLISQNGIGRIVRLDSLDLPDTSEKEAFYRALWVRLYNTIAITERLNEKCRSNHLPKKYRKHMTEFEAPSSLQLNALPKNQLPTKN